MHGCFSVDGGFDQHSRVTEAVMLACLCCVAVTLGRRFSQSFSLHQYYWFGIWPRCMFAEIVSFGKKFVTVQCRQAGQACHVLLESVARFWPPSVRLDFDLRCRCRGFSTSFGASMCSTRNGPSAMLRVFGFFRKPLAFCNNIWNKMKGTTEAMMTTRTQCLLCSSYVFVQHFRKWHPTLLE